MEGNLIIENTRIVTPLGSEAVKGPGMGKLYEIENGCIIIEKGRIIYSGPMKDRPTDQDFSKFKILDACGNVALPGFVDSHTHVMFGGFRPDEFEWRLKGDSYMSIMERGGGIQSTVNATKNATDYHLVNKTDWFLRKMSEMGVTTVEAKSGYGLDSVTELRLLNLLDYLNRHDDMFLDIVLTFMGAHAVPPEYAGRTADFVDELIKILPEAKKVATFCDVFCEKNVFEIEDSRRLLQEAKKAGFKLKLHADEIVTLGGAELSAELGAVSADHLLHVSDNGIKRMAEEGVVATLLPLTAFALKEPFAPARKFIEAGCAVALATDLNPGSCFSGSIPLTIALACIYMNMSIEETITALTLNGAAALDMAQEIGSLEKGKRGDVILLGSDNYRVLPYYVGMNCVKTTIFKGVIVCQNN
ncbi:MAG: imidazolonepropionase [Muribaculaceae bacterium]|nr:imidazolonepropionase [Muribaculaceae bacterium]